MIGDDGCCGVVIEEASVCISALQVSEPSKLLNSNIFLYMLVDRIATFIQPYLTLYLRSQIAIDTCQSLIPLHIKNDSCFNFVPFRYGERNRRIFMAIL